MIIMNPNPATSKREYWKSFYDTINLVAKPGDIVFFISERIHQSFSPLRRLYRKWQGLNENDNKIWHTAILVEPKKERKGAQWRPHIIHAMSRGVEEIFIPPSYFSSVRDDPSGEPIQNGRIEIVQNPGLSGVQRQAIVKYAQAQLGKPFAELGWRYDIWTYAFGVSPRKIDPQKVSCHGLAFSAYKNVGFSFPHQLNHAPFFNLAKYLGHPLGQPPNEVDVTRLYLRDHHLYLDPRLDCMLAIFEDETTRQTRLIQNPGKCCL